jgi:hypothetical protein
MADTTQSGGVSGGAKFIFEVTNGTSPHDNTVLWYHDSGADEAHLAAVNNDIGITFASQPGPGLNSRLWVVGNTITQRRDIGVWSVVYEGILQNASSIVAKRNVAAAQDLDLRQATRNARAKRFEKTYLDEPAVLSPDGVELRGPRKAPRQLGMIAEEMPAQCTGMIYQAVRENPDTGAPGMDLLGINLDNVVTLLWQGQGDVWDELDRRASAPVPVISTTTLPPPPLSGALLYEFGGEVFAVFPTGQRKKIV